MYFIIGLHQILAAELSEDEIKALSEGDKLVKAADEVDAELIMDDESRHSVMSTEDMGN